ncbi:MAG TPA: cysteine hydrolase [Alphaproteobacteria bacterium]|nr:cysteine hydrolase [Alphaproteobacteria bacterium]
MHKIHLPDWAVERGRNLNQFDRIDPRRTAFLGIDMQNVFLEAGEVFGNPNALDVIEPVNRAAKLLRDSGATVVWTRQTVSHEPPLAMPAWQYDMSIPSVARAVNTMVAGTRSHAIHAAMDVQAKDLVLDKYRYSAFMCPAGALQRFLTGTEIDTLVIGGTLTNCCCESTARDANMLGYKIVLLSDATAARTDEEQNAALLNIRISFGDVRTTHDLPAMISPT